MPYHFVGVAYFVRVFFNKIFDYIVACGLGINLVAHNVYGS